MNLRTLSKLSLCFNKYVNLKIKILDLSQNKINYLYVTQFKLLTRLVKIVMNNNLIKEIHSSLFKNNKLLELINFNKNKITTFNLKINRLSRLQTLSLNKNYGLLFDIYYFGKYIKKTKVSRPLKKRPTLKNILNIVGINFTCDCELLKLNSMDLSNINIDTGDTKCAAVNDVVNMEVDCLINKNQQCNDILTNYIDLCNPS